MEPNDLSLIRRSGDMAKLDVDSTTKKSLNRVFEAVPLRSKVSCRLRNLGKPRHWYMAVAEAIKNAMDSIEHSGRSGRIAVFLERHLDLASEPGGASPVRNVLVQDTGEGFTDENFESFCTPDSAYKHDRGGKGLGRLICLQAFEQVDVTSTFKAADDWKRRDVQLQSQEPELQHRLVDEVEGQFLTVVKLQGLRPEFDSHASVTFDAIATWLSEHFLPGLVERPAWLEALTLHDGEYERDLTAIIKGNALWSEEFTINAYSFYSACYPLVSNKGTDQVRLVAGGRVVDANTRPLEEYVPHLSTVADERVHVVLVKSSFFDEHVNDARNGVSFSDEEDGVLLGITAQEFREKLATSLRRNLNARLSACDSELRKRVEEIVRREAPYYRPLLSGYFESKDFAALKKTDREEAVLASLDAYRRRETAGLKKESKRLSRLTAESENYEAQANQLTKQIDTQKQVALAEYVSLRKIILDQLESLLDLNSAGQASREQAIHNLIFRQRSNTEEDAPLEHQLWILDERLESHAYLASDEPLDGKTGDRPDLLIALDRPGAFASDSSPRAKGYERIAIVEFKRALKNLSNVSTDELPHRQMMRYANTISKEKAVHVGSGRPIKVAADVRFYLYAVCELPADLLERLLRDEGFIASPTSDGAFTVLNDGRYYIEYISLPKLLEDARLRNQSFFRKLGLEG